MSFNLKLTCVALTASASLIPQCRAAATLVSTFQAGDAGWNLGTLAVGNLDNSPDLEIVIPYRDSTGTWHLDAFKCNGQRLRGFPYTTGADVMNVSPTLYDLDHDGRDEIIFTRS